MSKERDYWDAELDKISQKKSANFLIVLISCDGQIHDTDVLGPGDRVVMPNKPSWFTGILRISLPRGTKERFQSIAGTTLDEPPEYQRLNG